MANTGSGSERPAVHRLFARSRWPISSIVLWESNGYSECDGLGRWCLSALRRIAASRSAPTHVRGCLGIAVPRPGLNTRAKRLGLIAGYRAPPKPRPPISVPVRHIEATHPGELVQLDCFYVGKLAGSRGAPGRTPPLMRQTAAGT